MKKRALTYTILGAVALALMAPAAALSQMGPRAQGRWTAPPARAWAQGFASRGPQRPGGRGHAGPRAQRFAGRGGPQFAGGRAQDRGGRGFAGRRGPELAGRGGGAARRAGGGMATQALARADAIGLTAAQEAQIREAQRTHQAASIERRATMQIAQLDVRDLMGAGTKDIAAIEAKLREVSDLEIAALTSDLYLDQAVGEVLTAEQLEELNDTSPRGRGRGGRGRGPARRQDAIR